MTDDELIAKAVAAGKVRRIPMGKVSGRLESRRERRELMDTLLTLDERRGPGQPRGPVIFYGHGRG